LLHALRRGHCERTQPPGPNILEMHGEVPEPSLNTPANEIGKALRDVFVARALRRCQFST
jgi:hypothetical protein